MAVPDRSIDPRILECARKQFLEKGYENTSLKEICKEADITTGAFYKRYKGKEDLFDALVDDTVNAIDQVIRTRSSVPMSELTDAQLVRPWDMDKDDMMWWMEFLFRHREGFTLLLKCSNGTHWSDYHHQLVARMTDVTWKFWEEASRRGLSDRHFKKEELHILLSAFWTTIYEPFIHGFAWEQLEPYCEMICRLFNWYSVLGLSPDIIKN